MLNSIKSQLYNGRMCCVKKEGNSFDVSMGAHDGGGMLKRIDILVVLFIGKYNYEIIMITKF